MFIVYDGDRVEQPGPHLFDRSHWERLDAVRGEAAGRGSAVFVETGFGPAVLREYLRGGWAASVSRDRYLFTGYRRSRPVREFNMLAWLQQRELPAPTPLAALCQRRGPLYRAGLLTRRIPNTITFSERVEQGDEDPSLWRAVGWCISRFHRAGVVHADLNARNILVDSSGHVYLVDFDRARRSDHGRRAFEANLKRLQRSLLKFWPHGTERPELWSMLREAYCEAMEADDTSNDRI